MTTRRSASARKTSEYGNLRKMTRRSSPSTKANNSGFRDAAPTAASNARTNSRPSPGDVDSYQLRASRDSAFASGRKTTRINGRVAVARREPDPTEEHWTDRH